MMAIDGELCRRIEAVLREYASETVRAAPGFEDRLRLTVDDIAFLAKIALSEVKLLPPPAFRKEGVRQPSALARQVMVDRLAETYSDFLTGKQPERSDKRGGFSAFAGDVFQAARISRKGLAYAVQLACEKLR